MGIVYVAFGPLYWFWAAVALVAAVGAVYGVLLLAAWLWQSAGLPIPAADPPAWWGPVGGTCLVAAAALLVALAR